MEKNSKLKSKVQKQIQDQAQYTEPVTLGKKSKCNNFLAILSSDLRAQLYTGRGNHGEGEMPNITPAFMQDF